MSKTMTRIKMRTKTRMRAKARTRTKTTARAKTRTRTKTGIKMRTNDLRSKAASGSARLLHEGSICRALTTKQRSQSKIQHNNFCIGYGGHCEKQATQHCKTARSAVQSHDQF